ncbi:hypothetical protein SAMN05421770_103477 [Granulicella rosea]|uniref:Uncharacterized protein n=1 Tax=Granulicella rosea TaxID=474952 RepID=A0A239J7R5_9BACT|nr:hypothetical protein [Granulicella rosea]SNT01819.1 hypothetical protein SAMN05421770_103477 [Granulicella rosea]
MTEEFEISQGKSAGELGREALWFFAHTLIAIAILAVIVVGGLVMRVDQDAIPPKAIGTILALMVPMLGGFVIAKTQQNVIARYVWISGLLIFSVVCVWVLDLPTGNGLCEHCGALEKLWRTFFDVENGSGLMGGDGLLIGTWIPLSVIGYSIGARLGLDQ